MIVVDLPPEIESKIKNANFWPESASGGQRGADGRTQVIYSENRVMNGELDIAPILGAGVSAVRAFMASIGGRHVAIRVPVCNLHTPVAGGSASEFLKRAGFSDEVIASDRGEPFDDGNFFDDGLGWELPTSEDPVLWAPALEGDSEIHMDGGSGRILVPGAYVSINDFLHIVANNENGKATISPPLRQDFAIGQVVNISKPTGLFRLAIDGGLKFFTELGRFNKPFKISLEEVFER